MKTIRVQLQERSYPIFISHEKNEFKVFAEKLARLKPGNSALIITNPTIGGLYVSKLINALEANGIHACRYYVKDSEESKSIKTFVAVVQKASSLDVKKRLFFIALGGGVVGDLTGFAAAAYKRGIPYVQVPTTLLAQVDSAIGGKTAIDLPAGKNLVGAFYQPLMVYSDINVLKSLPLRQIKSGLAEVIKYGVILDRQLFGYLEKNYARLLRADPDCLAHVIAAAGRIKAHVVAVDEHETAGFRTILNFGHTIGHALETATGYTQLAHGEAVSIGMAAAADIALELGIFDPKSFWRLINLLGHLQLPVQAPKVDLKAVLNAFYRDKKFIRGAVRMVLPTKIGHVIVTENIPWTVINKIIKKRVANHEY